MRQLPVPVGQRFGRLVVTGPAPRIDKNSRWACRCDCGGAIDCRPSHLKNGNIQSCGCLASERARDRLTTHGQSYTRLYMRWNSMLARCYYPVTRGYRHYGGRGIKVCDRWRNSFADFLADMGEPPGPRYSLDRIDNDGDYEPGNVRWATGQEQYANTPKAKMYRLKEMSMTGQYSQIRATLVKDVRHGNKPARLKHSAETWIGTIDEIHKVGKNAENEAAFRNAHAHFVWTANGAPAPAPKSAAELASVFGLHPATPQ